LAFDFEDAFVGGENFALVIFEFWRSETLGVDEGLLAFVIGGSVGEIGPGDFDVVAEDLLKRILREPMPVRLRSRSSNGGDDLLAVFAGVAEVVEFGVVAGADHAGFGCGGGRLVGEGFFEFFTDVGELVDFFVEVAEEIAAAGLWRREEIFRTGSCARDLRSARKFRVARRGRE